jgi:serine/threonine protein kinase
LIGTARYASTNALMGAELSRRDDIESLAYILIYFMRGSLPWQGTKSDKRQAYVRKKKLSITPDELCHGLPIEFQQCLQYARSLEFSQRPDYQYLRTLFADLRNQGDTHDGAEFRTFGTLLCHNSAPVPLLITGSDCTKTETSH